MTETPDQLTTDDDRRCRCAQQGGQLTDSDKPDDSGEPNSSRDRLVAITVEPGRAIAFGSTMPENDPSLPGVEEARRIVRALKSYREALHKLVSSQYANVADMLPSHFRQPANIIILRCLDGTLVRYESCTEGNPWARCGSMAQTLEAVAPGLTDHFVFFPSDPATFVPPADAGPRMTMAKADAVGVVEEFFTIQPFVLATLGTPVVPTDGARPIPIVSVTNEIELQIGGTVMPAETTSREVAHKEEFIGRAQGVLPVGWQAIEVYPRLPIECWDEKQAPMWAERDLLAMLAQNNIVEASFSKLDGRREARQRYGALLKELESLLGGPEEPVHQFLKRNPELISPTSVRRWSKLPFGSRISDFVFLEPSNDYLLVEIEAPHRELFREDGQQRQELTHAINQIADWVQHIQDNKSEVERTLPGISSNPRALVVIGRSTSLSDENRRKLTTITGRDSKLRILTYDDLLATARAMLKQLFGPLDFETNLELYFFNRSPV